MPRRRRRRQSLVRNVLAGVLVAVGAGVYVSAGGVLTLLHSKLGGDSSGNGFTPGSWPVSGVAEPSVQWWADDPTGSGSITTHAFTETGSTTEANTPFCPDGSWDDLTSGCMKGRIFDGSSDYYDADLNTTGAIADDTDFSACFVAYKTHGSGKRIFGKSDTGNHGYSFYSGAANTFLFVVENAATATATAQAASAATMEKAWFTGCGVYDADGNMTAYINGSAGTPKAAPGGDINDEAEPLCVGCRSGAALLEGAFIAGYVWPATLLSTANIKAFHETFAGILDTKSAPITYTDSGPNCCWIDEKVECFTDNWAQMGCEQPPNATGAGAPSTGYLSMEALTNEVLYSRDLSTGWTQAGTPSPTATSTDLFRDGRSTYRITDNDAGAVESIYQNIAHGLSNGDKVQVCAYAKDSLGTVLDLLVTEMTGVCSGGATDYTFTQATIDSSWAQHSWTHTITDDTCTDVRIRLCPTECGTVASNGGAEFVVQVYLDQDWCPPTYIETAAAAVADGDTVLSYDISSSSVVDASGVLRVPVTVSMNFTPSDGYGTAASQRIWMIPDSAAPTTDYWEVLAVSSTVYRLVARSTAEGASRIVGEWSIAAPTVGTTYAYKWVVTDDYTEVQMFIDDVEQSNTASVSLGTTPDSLDTFYVGAQYNGTLQINSFMGDVKITR